MKKTLNASKVQILVAIELNIECKICGKEFMSSNEKRFSTSSISELQWNMPIAKCPKCNSKYVWNGNKSFDIINPKAIIKN